MLDGVTTIEMVRDIALGVALAAACGLRIFVPLLALSVAALTGVVHLSTGFAWIGSAPALVVFAVATVVEIAAYKVPWLDNVLDILGAPVAVAAGTLMAAAALPDSDPLLRWTLAAIAGGGTAATVHGTLAVVRKLSSLSTGGLGNILVALSEAVGAVLLSALAIFLPLVALAGAFLLVAGAIGLARRGRASRRTA